MAEVAEPVLKSDADLHLLLQRTRAWVFFWTRRYGDLKALLADVLPSMIRKARLVIESVCSTWIANT